MSKTRHLFTTLFALALGTSTAGTFAADWPAFRGPNGDSRIVASGLFAGEHPVALKKSWKRQIGEGYSGLTVAEGRLFTLFSDGQGNAVGAFDAATGEEHWRHRFGSASDSSSSPPNPANSTPLVADGRLFALSPTGQLVALGAASGKLLWQHNIAQDFGAMQPQFGFATSPVLAEGVLVLQVGAGEDKTVMGFDPVTGKTRWKVGHDAIGYQSPLVTEIGGRAVVLAVGDTKLFAIEPATGKVVLEHRYGASPARDGNNVTNPVPAGPGQVLLTRSLEDAVLLRFVTSPEGMTVEEVWTSQSLGHTYSSVVYHGGHFYGFRGSILHCLDGATGERVWRSREPGEGYLLLADGHLVINTTKGGVHVIAADPAGYREVASLQLFEEGRILTYPSLAGNNLYLRSFAEIARVEVQRAASGSKGQ